MRDTQPLITIKRWLLGVVLVLVISPLLAVVYTYTRAGESAHVQAATASTLNFQARLTSSSGALVADGNYSIQFKLYDAVSAGTNEWTETQAVVPVKNGYFNVYLGSTTPFSGSIDWSQEKWLTMNVNSDGEMNPRIKLTATPYSLRSGQADSLTITGGTITGDNLLQKAPGALQLVNSANTALRINQTGAGGLVQLAGNSTDVFTVDKSGNTVLGGSLSIGTGLTLGNSASTTSGTLRWSGTDFEGYDGFLWRSLTGGSGIGTPFVSKTKTANEQVVASTGFQDDDQLFFAVGANETWNFRFTIQANSPAAADLKFTVTAPSGATCTFSSGDFEGATSIANLGCGVTTGLVAGNGAADTYEIIGSIQNGATAGNLRLQWAQQVASGTTTVFAGSSLQASRSIGLSSTDVAFVQDGNTQGVDATLGTNDTFNLNFETNGVTNLTLDTSGNLNVINGALQTAGVTRITNAGLLQNVTADTSILTTGTLGVNRGGTGAGTFTTNGLLFGNGTSPLGVTSAGTGGQLLIANGSGVPTFVSLGGDGTLSNTGVLTIANSAITNTKLQNSGFNLAYGTNLSGDASVTLGGTLNLAISANPAFTSVSTGTLGVTGAITAATAGNTINGLVINAGALSGVTTLSASGDINTTGGALQTNSVTRITNAGNLTNIGTISAASGTLNLNANGDLTSTFTLLNGSSTANGAGTNATSLTLVNATNFDIGNYILVNSTYAKITNKVGNVLTITPALTWSNGAAVTEYHVPELGGTNTGSTLANRYGRGYFIAGIATGNGTTYYTEEGITTTLSTFNIANENVATVNIGGAATTLNIGTTGTTVNVLGNLATSSSQTITAGGGLTVSTGGADITGGINNNSGGITATGALAGVTTISASGAIAAATAGNTINGLIVNAGTLSGITGATFTSGGINLNAGGVTNAGAISGIAGLTLTSGNLALGSGNISGVGTIGLSGAITGATATNTINGLIINAGALSGITGATFTSGGINLNSGGITNAGTIGGVAGLTLSSGNLALGGGNITGGGSIAGTSLGVSGAITAATATNTINGLIINSGALSGITGATFTSGGINLNAGGITNTGSLAGVAGLALTSGNIALGGGNISGAGTVGLSGAVTAATTVNTINGLIINSGSLSGITGYGQTSGAFSVTGTGAITLGANSNALTIDSTNFDVSSAGALSGITSVNASGAITAATATNTINGLIISSGSLSGITGFSQTSGNFAISGTGTIGIGAGSNALTINSTNFDVSSAGALSGITSVSASGAIAAATTTDTINGLVVSSGSLSSVTGFNQGSGNFAVAGTGTFGTGSGAVSLNGATNIATSTNSATALTINGTTGTAATALQIAQNGNAANIAMTNTARTTGALVSLTQSTSAFTGTGLLFNFASGSGSFASGNFLDFQLNGASRFKVDNSGALQINSDSAGALQINNASGALAMLTVNTSGSLIQIGSATGDATAILLVLDSKNTAGDPTGVNGAQYYNASDKRFRCFEDSAWKDCIVSKAEVKLADQSVTNSATFANATDLVFPVEANSTYTFTASINFSSTSATADYKYTFTVPTGAVVAIQSAAPTGAAASTTCNITTSGQTCSIASTAGYRGVMDITGYVKTAATAGNTQFQFAQNAAVAGQSATVYSGSSINWKRTLP